MMKCDRKVTKIMPDAENKSDIVLSDNVITVHTYTNSGLVYHL